MIVLYLFQLLLLIPFCLAVPPPVAAPVAAPMVAPGLPPPAAGKGPPPKEARKRVTELPVQNAQAEGFVAVDKKLPPALLKEIGQAQKQADVKANANLLESVSGGFWGKDTGNASSAGAGGQVPKVPTVPKSPPPTPPALSKRALPRAFIPCLQGFNSRIVGPRDPQWGEYSSLYNTRNKAKPDLIVVGTNSKEVADAVYCASTNGVTVQARAGGHSYGGFSSGRNGGLVIDLRYMDKVSFSKTSNNVLVGSGIRLGNLGLALLENDRAISHGDCPSVGLAGHSLHGGFGYTSRMWGLSTDAIHGLEVVTATGDVEYCDDKKNPDLYWAMRGAGDSFGIAVKFYLTTQKAPRTVIHFTYEMPEVFGEAKYMALVFFNVQNCVRNPATSAKDMGLTIRIASGSFRVAGYYYGNQEDATFANMIACFAEATRAREKRPRKAKIEKLTFGQALSTIAGAVPVQQPVDANNARSNFFAKSLLVPEREPLSLKVLNTYFQYVVDAGTQLPNQWVFTFRLMGGAKSKVPSKGDSFSAVSNRDSLWIVQHDGQTVQRPKEVMVFVEGSSKALQTLAGGQGWGSFAPFLDPSLSNSQAHKAYFSPSTYKKLKYLKAKYDERMVFTNPQSVVY